MSEKIFQRQDAKGPMSQGNYFSPSSASIKGFKKGPKRHSTRGMDVSKIITTKAGVFAPTLFGASTFNGYKDQLDRRDGSLGQTIPVDNYRLDNSRCQETVGHLNQVGLPQHKSHLKNGAVSLYKG